VHARSAAAVVAIKDELLAAYTFGDSAPVTPPLLLGHVG
jgi:hypothetical protein